MNKVLSVWFWVALTIAVLNIEGCTGEVVLNTLHLFVALIVNLFFNDDFLTKLFKHDDE